MTPDHQDVAGSLEDVARQVASEGPQADVAALVDTIRKTDRRPRELDAKSIGKSRGVLGGDLDASQKSTVRATFLSSLKARLDRRSV